MNEFPNEADELEHRMRVALDVEQEDIPRQPWRRVLHEVIFGVDSPAGHVFDIALLIAIIGSVVAVMLESVESINKRWHTELILVEWGLTVLFTVEYVLRIICVTRPWKYMRSFFGIVDLLSILPSYIDLFIGGAHTLSVIRALRLLRIFRVLKLVHYLKEASHLWVALKATQRKITVFLVVVLTVLLIMGSAMYLIEGPEHGFDSIPKSTYWAIVTMTTVGYGDIAPKTVLGQTLAAVAMIIGYSIIIVPTGIFSVEVVAAAQQGTRKSACMQCGLQWHDNDARFCKQCGEKLAPPEGHQGMYVPENSI